MAKPLSILLIISSLLLLAFSIVLIASKIKESYIECPSAEDILYPIKVPISTIGDMFSTCYPNAEAMKKGKPSFDPDQYLASKYPNAKMNDLSKSQIDEAESSCRQCFLPYMNQPPIDKNQYCKKECINTNSKECSNCLYDFQCRASNGNEIPMPCIVKNYIPKENQDQMMNDNMTAIRSAKVCDVACHDYTNPTDECKQCIDYYISYGL